jgi:tRNA(Ile)-lysidine synthase
LLRPLCGARGLVLAVSGGPDSTALMHLAAEWRRAQLVPVSVATVDHGLQPGSAAVAARVVDRAASLGLPGVVLHWEGDKPRTGLQSAARVARYALLTSHAARVEASHLVTAHTEDDQAETVLIRLAAGSGLAGLAGMRATASLNGLVLARPLLGVTKAALVALCRENGWPFVEDMANSDPRFARARWRELAPILAAEGLTARRLARLAARVARAEEALAGVVAAAAGRCRVCDEPDRRSFDAAALLGEADEIALRVLGQALETVGGRPVRLHRLERLLAALREGNRHGRRLGRTLQGCKVELAAGALTIHPEAPRRGRGAAAGFDAR